LSTAENKAARIGGFSAIVSAAGKNNVHRYATSASSVSAALPTAMPGAFMRILSVGANTQIGFGFGAAPTLIYNELAAFGTGDVNAGGTCVDGIPEHVIVPPKATHIAWISSATGGFVEFMRSEQDTLQASK
jgi:hypothetical protein